eukprot:362848-Chlamydomonas_euryale.AAC.3
MQMGSSATALPCAWAAPRQPSHAHGQLRDSPPMHMGSSATALPCRWAAPPPPSHAHEQLRRPLPMQMGSSATALPCKWAAYHRPPMHMGSLPPPLTTHLAALPPDHTAAFKHAVPVAALSGGAPRAAAPRRAPAPPQQSTRAEKEWADGDNTDAKPRHGVLTRRPALQPTPPPAFAAPADRQRVVRMVSRSTEERRGRGRARGASGRRHRSAATSACASPYFLAPPRELRRTPTGAMSHGTHDTSTESSLPPARALATRQRPGRTMSVFERDSRP